MNVSQYTGRKSHTTSFLSFKEHHSLFVCVEEFSVRWVGDDSVTCTVGHGGRGEKRRAMRCGDSANPVIITDVEAEQLFKH